MRLSYLLNALGTILCHIGFVAFLPIIVALIYSDYNSIIPFFSVGTVAVLIGTILKKIYSKNLSNDKMSDIKKSEAMAIVLLAWVSYGIISSIPFLFYGLPSIDAFFEGFSGATSTGASILVNFDFPKTFFFWRSLIQWIGGLGILILFIAILPQFAVAGRQMFFTETPGPTEDAFTPRIRNTAKALWSIYLILTILQICILVFLKMNLFDAICNSLCTISSGGFSPHAKSIMGYDSLAINWVFIVFMFFAGTNLALIYNLFSKFDILSIFKNEEFKFYVGIVATITMLISLAMFLNSGRFDFFQFTHNLFTTLSLITSTGFVTQDYTTWCTSAQILLFLVFLFGACAGSTGGGIKILRAIMVFKYLKREIIKIIHPNAVINIKFNHTNVTKEVLSQIMGFVMFYIIFLISSTVMIAILENNALSGFSGAFSTLNLVGPGFGNILGPSSSYQSFQPLSKLICIFNMLVGRLELIPFLILLNRDFWSLKK